jgi:hypothetical protein
MTITNFRRRFCAVGYKRIFCRIVFLCDFSFQKFPLSLSLLRGYFFSFPLSLEVLNLTNCTTEQHGKDHSE